LSLRGFANGRSRLVVKDYQLAVRAFMGINPLKALLQAGNLSWMSGFAS
jgi:hypothetical protein